MGAPGMTPSAAQRRPFADLALLVAGAALTVALTYGFIYWPLPTAALLLATVVVGGCVIFRRELSAVRLAPLVAGLALLLPLAALIGPPAALPVLPQLFAFRVLLLLVAVVGVPLLLLRPISAPLTRGRLAATLVLWAAWLAVTLLWAPDKAAGLRYLLVLATMLAVVAAAAAAGASRRRLVIFGVTMLVAYALIVGVTVFEAVTGLHVPTSRLVAGAGSATYAVSSVFHNQNDLATYLALCWPFLLAVPFFTRRAGWLALALVASALGASAFVRTGSRSSLLAIGISTLVILLLLARPGGWLQTRRAWALGALLAVALLAGAGYLLFNQSESPMLREFRLDKLVSDMAAGQGSGDIRSSLYERGLSIAGGSFLLGAGPGQAPLINTSGTDALGIGELHNWWLEVYVEGGLPGLLLHLAFFFGLLLGLLRRARAPGDPFVHYLAVGAAAALAGFIVGSLGPSSVLGFAPMWALYGLGLAILGLPSRATGGSDATAVAGPPAVEAGRPSPPEARP